MTKNGVGVILLLDKSSLKKEVDMNIVSSRDFRTNPDHILPFKNSMEIECKICRKKTGGETYFIQDKWIICDDCKYAKEKAEREITQAEEEHSSLGAQLREKYPYICPKCGGSYMEEQLYCNVDCPRCLVRVSHDEEAYTGSLLDRWIEAGERVNQLRKAFSGKF